MKDEGTKEYIDSTDRLIEGGTTIVSVLPKYDDNEGF